MPPPEQDELFDVSALVSDELVVVNEQCRIQIRDGHHVVLVRGVPLAHYAAGDRGGEAHAMVSLVELGWARQNEVARAFGRSERTVRRHQRRWEDGGIAALSRPIGYPKGRSRLPSKRIRVMQEWAAEGVSIREMARRLVVDEKAVRKSLRRLGWWPEPSKQIALDLIGADPNVSGPRTGSDAEERQEPAGWHEQSSSRPAEESTGADPNVSGPGHGSKERAAPPPPEAAAKVGLAPPEPVATEPPSADPNVSGIADQTSVSLDTDPSNREVDRLLACIGLLDDATPVFRSGADVPGAGVLLAIPALVESGVVEIAREVYGSIGPAFYGLRTTIVTLLLMALLRIKRPEALKERSPAGLGRLLGLDRAPEVKTLRRKLARIAATGRAKEFGRALARRRVESRGHAFGFLYVDGHVRAYHGERTIPKTHVARIRLAMPATTDYWVNDAEGEPLFVVTTEANDGLVKMLPKVLEEARKLIKDDRRLTFVFDRGGWSPALFAKLIDGGADILTYRKAPFRRVAKKLFTEHEAELDGRKLKYALADQNVVLKYREGKHRRHLRLRQVTRLGDDGRHQTMVVTSRRDLTAIEVAYRMFERWRQENFFKYLREEYALDALVDYSVEPADEMRSVPNPKRKEANAKLKQAYAEMTLLQFELGLEAHDNVESLRRTMRGFKIANAELRKGIFAAMKKVADLEARRAKIPTRVPVKTVVEGEVIKLATERKHLTDLLKMVAYQGEGDLLRMVAPDYRRADDEGRTLIQNALSTAGDIEVNGDALHIRLDPLSSPHRTRLLAKLCDQLNETRTRFPGSRLRLHFTVKPEPPPCLAFPGARHQPVPAKKPDISGEG